MIYFFIFILGLAIGSFLDVLIDRIPRGESILGRSHCEYCKKQLRWYELIPLFSFLIQGGKSRCCRKKLSLQYPLVEVITGIFFVIIFVIPSDTGLLIGSLDALRLLGMTIKEALRLLGMTIKFGIISCLIVVFFIDLKYQIIPDSIQVALFIFVLLFSAISYKLQVTNNYLLLITNYLFSGFIVMAPILLLWLVTKGRGMGFGDVKLAFTMGVLLGIKGGLMALYIAFVTGAVTGVILLIGKKKGLKSKIAFGPFLVIGTVIVLFFFG